jgi:hypothetical protein
MFPSGPVIVRDGGAGSTSEVVFNGLASSTCARAPGPGAPHPASIPSTKIPPTNPRIPASIRSNVAHSSSNRLGENSSANPSHVMPAKAGIHDFAGQAKNRLARQCPPH